jgi:uncharacterized protein (DUF885 family)
MQLVQIATRCGLATSPAHKLDLPATYEWGKQELKAINDRMWELAKIINPQAKTLREVADTLDNDPKYKVVGPRKC